MNAILSKLIDQLNSSVFVLLMLLAAAFYACIKITNIVTKWTAKHDRNDDKITRIETKIENMNETVIATRERVQIIYEHVIQRGPLAGSSSPISLTSQGKEVAGEIGAEEIFNKNLKSLINKVNEENPQTAYDIQTVSFKVANDEISKMLTHEEMDRIKQSAFNRGF